MFSIFGSWIQNVKILNNEFISAKPFEHVIIDEFFNTKFAEQLEQNFPSENNINWCQYNNPIEKKFALNNFENLELYNYLFNILQNDKFIMLMSEICEIADLEKDPYLHGAGLHFHKRHGKLDMHLDYNIHPISGKERRINLIIYLNKNWLEKYKGDLQLWNSEFTNVQKKIYPIFNRAVIFKTSDISYHGIPDPIECEDNMKRKSIAIYYVSSPRKDCKNIRYKAEFRPLPGQIINENMIELYRIRATRRIEEKDLV